MGANGLGDLRELHRTLTVLVGKHWDVATQQEKEARLYARDTERRLDFARTEGGFRQVVLTRLECSDINTRAALGFRERREAQGQVTAIQSVVRSLRDQIVFHQEGVKACMRKVRIMREGAKLTGCNPYPA